MTAVDDHRKEARELRREAEALRQQLAQLEQALGETQQQMEVLRHSEAKYCMLLDESSDPIFSFSADGQYQYVNRAFADGVGRRLDEIIGHRIWDVFPREEADKRYAVVRAVFASGESKVIEVRVPRPEGDRYYMTTVKPIFDDQQQVRYVICISKEITERKNMESRLAHMAQHDLLTDLPNRLLFNDHLQVAIAHARRNRTRLVLMAIDLDHFKPVNDAFGHQIGDQLLQAVAQRMQGCLRESDTVGRIGGDEFLVLLPAIQAEEDALRVAGKIRQGLRQAFCLPGCPPLNISSSIGLAFYPDHADEPGELMRNADIALYRAKVNGRDKVELFSPT